MRAILCTIGNTALVRVPLHLALLVSLLLFVLLAACATQAAQQVSEPSSNAEAGFQDEGLIRDFRVQVFCSQTTIRTGGVDLTWEADVEDVRIDLTVYKDGFEKGLVTSFFPRGEGKRFIAPDQARLEFGPAYRPVTLPVTEFKQDRETGRADLQVEGLEPGVNHFWRISAITPDGVVLGATRRSLAAVCPADLVE